MKIQILNDNFLELDKDNMFKVIGGDETTPTGTFWLSDLIKYLKSLF